MVAQARAPRRCAQCAQICRNLIATSALGTVAKIFAKRGFLASRARIAAASAIESCCIDLRKSFFLKRYFLVAFEIPRSVSSKSSVRPVVPLPSREGLSRVLARGCREMQGHAAARARASALSSYPRPKPHRPHRVSEIRDLEAVHCTVPVCDKRQTFLPAADLLATLRKRLCFACLLAGALCVDSTDPFAKCGFRVVVAGRYLVSCLCVDSTDPFSKCLILVPLENPRRCVSPPSIATTAWQCFVW